MRKKLKLSSTLAGLGLFLVLILAACGGESVAVSPVGGNVTASNAPLATTGQSYNIGTPNLKDLWVDPQKGSDANSGESRATALRSLTAAWQKIPQGAPLRGSGYRVFITAGTLAKDAIPNYLEKRSGTAQTPIIFQAADGRGSVTLKGDLNVFEVRYLYIIDLNIIPDPAGDTFHCEKCDHILLRGLTLSGGKRAAQETVKFNQSQYVYIEDNKISGANDNAIDFVAVQYGQISGNEISEAEDWCVYVKGGSASILIERNQVYTCGTGGISAGQGTGFEYMVAPWLHYEAYDIKIVNNLVRQTAGAGLGVNGGYNILVAYNTLYQVGQRSHVLEVVFGSRSCDGNLAKCQENLKAGGWGVKERDKELFIPNRNIYIYNNLIYNPPGYQSAWQHLAIYSPRPTLSGSNLNSPAATDVNLQIKGNVIWNGPTNLPLGAGEPDQGCPASNLTCNPTQLKKDNSLNTLQPNLPEIGNGNYRPASSFAARSVAIPPFPGGDAPPQVPPSNLSNEIKRDFSGKDRPPDSLPGAFASSS